MKTKNIVIVALLVALIGGGWFVYRNMFDWARIQAEKVASESLGVKVTIGSIGASFRDKSVSVKNIKIGNPKGFDTAYAVKLGDIQVVADVLSRDKVVIKKVLVSDNNINLEMKGASSNLNALQSGIKKSGKPTASEKTSKTPTLNIKDLVIDKSSINFQSDLVKNNGEVVMPTIHLKNVGQDNNQASAVVAQITRAVLNEALTAAARSGVLQNLSKAGTDALKGGLKTGTDELKKSLGKIKL
jgi:uncharacterized protein involved in outer membrane biogenesis